MSVVLKRCVLCALVAVLAVCLGFVPASAQKATQKKNAALPGGRAADAKRHSEEAAKVLREVMSVPDKAVPRELIDKAEAIAVCPNVLKAAFIVGGRKGDCVISRRTPKRQWGAPVYYNMAGGSFGAQIGAAKTDYVLLFMNDEALKGLMEDKFEIGGEVEVAAGPVGRAAGAGTNPTLDAGILTYSRSEGAFIGASLKGVAITPDNDLNEAFYGKKASELINAQADTTVPSSVRAFPLALNRYSVRQGD